MKIQVDSSRLAKVCSLALKNIPSRTTLPIIRNLHVVAEADMLHVSSTDMETYTVHDVPAEVQMDGTPNAFCIDAVNITNLLMAIPSQPIVIELLERKDAGTITFYAKISHSCGTSELPAVSADEYPTLKLIQGEAHSVPTDVLVKSIQTCSFATFSDAEAKPSLAAVCLDFKESSMVAVASDGSVMARLEHPDMGGNTVCYLIPKKALGLLKQALDAVLKDKDAKDVMIRKDDFNICFQTEHSSIYFRQIEQRYPNYDAVIPAKGTFRYEAVMNRQDVLSAITRTSIFANPESMKLSFRFDGCKDYVAIIGECIEFATSSEEKVKCEFTESAALTIALKATALKEILTHMASEQVRFSLINFDRQVIITEVNGNDGLLFLIMPMVLN